MKNISTRIAALLLLMLFSGAALAETLEINPDAPDRYVVVKGDTLWAIAGRFLSKPWRWPEIWQLNRDQIRDPHWIYPGDIVYLDRSGANPRLRLGRPVASTESDDDSVVTERRSPAVRATALEREPIPTISAAAIEPFLNRPLVVGEQELAEHPRIVAAAESHVYMSKGDLAYIRGKVDPNVAEWHIYRSAAALLDPETRKPIAWEAQFIGSARLVKVGDPSTFRITGVREEIGIGDRLMPADRSAPPSYAPRSPEQPVAGRVVAIYRGVAQAGRDNVLALDLGSTQGLALGHVLQIRQNDRVLLDREAKSTVSVPGESIGHVLVFRLFERIAYGLIMDASQPVSIGDRVINP